MWNSSAAHALLARFGIRGLVKGARIASPNMGPSEAPQQSEC